MTFHVYIYLISSSIIFSFSPHTHIYSLPKYLFYFLFGGREIKCIYLRMLTGVWVMGLLLFLKTPFENAIALLLLV